VSQVNRLLLCEDRLLPAADDDATWQKLVDGNFGVAQSWSVGGLFWGTVDLGLKVANPALRLAGKIAGALPLPRLAKFLQPPYTIDAEDIILEPLADGVALAMNSKPEWLLKNR
jgi:hypothetical protein